MAEPENMNTNKDDAIALLAQGHEAVLATLEEERPFASAVSYLYRPPIDPDRFGKLYLLMSALARHTKNVKKNSFASVFVIEDGEPYVYERRRVSAQGKLEEIPRATALFDTLKIQYLKLFPQASMLFSLPDFYFYELSIQELYFIGGFGKIQALR